MATPPLRFFLQFLRYNIYSKRTAGQVTDQTGRHEKGQVNGNSSFQRRPKTTLTVLLRIQMFWGYAQVRIRGAFSAFMYKNGAYHRLSGRSIYNVFYALFIEHVFAIGSLIKLC